ncbi:uncharacterized protein BJX67DRAFT_346914 [Aspergillus lucknowensis]|uniref:Uncharacterized protein n=1 Tax=Aspergillus lucknowensis TaxID=176173 RepID=A0ABR4LZ15_9EURO
MRPTSARPRMPVPTDAPVPAARRSAEVVTACLAVNESAVRVRRPSAAPVWKPR